MMIIRIMMVMRRKRKIIKTLNQYKGN
jgi:hypothetical protein